MIQVAGQVQDQMADRVARFERPGPQLGVAQAGCHLADGSGVPDAVPSFAGVGRFLHTSRGREYLIRVPGASQSPLSDAALAALLDWIVARFDPATAATGFRPFDAAEVSKWRRPPLSEVAALRRALLAELDGSGAASGLGADGSPRR